MYSTLITAVALFAAPVLAGFAVNNPTLKQCGTSKISWAPAKAPYNVIAVSAADPCGEPLVEIGDFEGTSIDWKAVLPAGTIVQISVADSSDEEAWSGNITVAASDDTSCLGASNVASSSSTGSAAAASATGSTTSTDTGSTTDTTTADGKAPDIVGAANAGTNDLFNKSGASARQASLPIMALGALAAVAAMAL